MAEKNRCFQERRCAEAALKNGEVNVLEPTINYDFGVKYSKLKELGLSRDEALSILNELCEAGIFTGELISNIATCPSCRSHKLLFQRSCPSCGSTKLSKGTAIEHLLCGYIDVEDNFRKGEDFVCPKCGKLLKVIGVDYRKPGVLYKCLDCQTTFPVVEKPAVIRGKAGVDHDFSFAVWTSKMIWKASLQMWLASLWF